MDNFIFAVLAARMILSRIGNEVFRQIDAFAGDPPQLFWLSLVVLAKIMDLLDQLFEGNTIHILGLCIVGKDKNLVFKG